MNRRAKYRGKKQRTSFTLARILTLTGVILLLPVSAGDAMAAVTTPLTPQQLGTGMLHFVTPYDGSAYYGDVTNVDHLATTGLAFQYQEDGTTSNRVGSTIAYNENSGNSNAGDLIYVKLTSGGKARLVEAKDGGTSAEIGSNDDVIGGMAVDSNGNIYLCNTTAGKIVTVDKNLANLADVATNLDTPVDIAIAPHGGLLYICEDSTVPTITTWSSSSGKNDLITYESGDHVRGIAFHGDDMFVTYTDSSETDNFVKRYAWSGSAYTTATTIVTDDSATTYDTIGRVEANDMGDLAVSYTDTASNEGGVVVYNRAGEVLWQFNKDVSMTDATYLTTPAGTASPKDEAYVKQQVAKNIHLGNDQDNNYGAINYGDGTKNKRPIETYLRLLTGEGDATTVSYGAQTDWVGHFDNRMITDIRTGSDLGSSPDDKNGNEKANACADWIIQEMEAWSGTATNFTVEKLPVDNRDMTSFSKSNIIGDGTTTYDEDDVPTTYNVVATIPGTKYSNEIVVVYAHMDSVNFVNDDNHVGTTDTGKGKAPGAWDSASGCAELILITKELAKSSYKFKHTIKIVFMNGEEMSRNGQDPFHPTLSTTIASDAMIKYFNESGFKVIAALGAETGFNHWKIYGDITGTVPINYGMAAITSVHTEEHSEIPEATTLQGMRRDNTILFTGHRTDRSLTTDDPPVLPVDAYDTWYDSVREEMGGTADITAFVTNLIPSVHGIPATWVDILTWKYVDQGITYWEGPWHTALDDVDTDLTNEITLESGTPTIKSAAADSSSTDKTYINYRMLTDEAAGIATTVVDLAEYASATEAPATDHFASPYFSTVDGDNNDITYVVIHNNGPTTATATFKFFKNQGGTTPTWDSNLEAPTIEPGEQIVLDLESDTTGVDLLTNIAGAFTVNISGDGTDPNHITINQFIAGDNHQIFVVPVRRPSSQSVGPMFSSEDSKTTYIELFNRGSVDPLSVKLYFYEKNQEGGSPTAIASPTVSVNADETRIFTVNSTAGDLVTDKTGFFIIEVGDEDPPATLTVGCHIFDDPDLFAVAVQNPQSERGLTSALFRAKSDASSVVKMDTEVSLVNTGPDTVTAEFTLAFTDGGGGSEAVAEVVLDPKEMRIVKFSDEFGLGASELHTGGYRIEITGTAGTEDLNQVSAVAFATDIDNNDHIGTLLERPQNGHVGYYDTATTGAKTFIYLYNSYDYTEAIDYSIRFIHGTSGNVTIYNPADIEPGDMVKIDVEEDVLPGATPLFDSWGAFVIDYKIEGTNANPTRGKFSVQATSYVDVNDEIWTFNVQPVYTAPSLTLSMTTITATTGTLMDDTQITGGCFLGTPTIKLTKYGKPDIVATDVNVSNSNTITCDFDLGDDPGTSDDVDTGKWNLVVTHATQFYGNVEGGIAWAELTVNAP